MIWIGPVKIGMGMVNIGMGLHAYTRGDLDTVANYEPRHDLHRESTYMELSLNSGAKEDINRCVTE